MSEADPQVRVRLDISYDGTDFSGWARQPGRRTVQQVVQEALQTVLRLPSVQVTVAGRTDAGVHASGQVAHVDLPVPALDEGCAKVHRRLAGVLPADVRVMQLRVVPAEFDARFSALWRRYIYRACDRVAGVDPLRRREVVGWPRPLDVDRMQAAAVGLVGLHDFIAFCRLRAHATTVRGVQSFDVERNGADVRFVVQADAFCHSMVRSMVGALLAVGDGRRPAEWPASLLRLTARSDDVVVAPAHGLTLVEVAYPPDSELRSRAERTRARRDALAVGPRPPTEWPVGR